MPEASAGHAIHEEHHDPVAARMGMWLFLFTEAILFGVFFIVYAVYLRLYPWDFRAGSRLLDRFMGAGNTVILLTSSLTMALAIAALERGRKGLSNLMGAATILCALGFLVVKGFEWSHKFHHGYVPRSPEVLRWPPGQQVFLSLYYCMTGLHALHVLLGMAMIGWALWVVSRRAEAERNATLLGNVGLYWHLVDLVWIFLFPLFYLIG